MQRINVLLLGLATSIGFLPANVEPNPPQHSFQISGRQFLLDGKTLADHFGEMHFVQLRGHSQPVLSQ